jgi:hypothetical protein
MTEQYRLREWMKKDWVISRVDVSLKLRHHAWFTTQGNIFSGLHIHHVIGSSGKLWQSLLKVLLLGWDIDIYWLWLWTVRIVLLEPDSLTLLRNVFSGPA